MQNLDFSTVRWSLSATSIYSGSYYGLTRKLCLSNNHIAYLVEDKIDFDVFKTRPSVTDLIEDLPDDCKPLLNLSLAHLADKFPFDIAKMIWDFTSEKIDETPHERRAIAHMSDYLDGIFVFWLKKGLRTPWYPLTD